MTILPFTYLDGVPTLKDSDLCRLFQTAGMQGLLEKIFFDNFVTEDAFINFVKTVPYFFLIIDKGQEVGFAYLTNVSRCSAHIHSLFFQNCRGKKCVKIAKQAIREMFKYTGLRTFVGVTPENNKQAVAFSRMVGFKFMTKLPNYLWDDFEGSPVAGVITQITGV